MLLSAYSLFSRLSFVVECSFQGQIGGFAPSTAEPQRQPILRKYWIHPQINYVGSTDGAMCIRFVARNA
ncbi:MAG: hypothetical protein AAF844_02270 [Pseudomonadota bacterium]